MRVAWLMPQTQTVGRPLAPLPVDPVFSGLTEPGSTLVARIYDADGRLLGDRQVVADSAGNVTTLEENGQVPLISAPQGGFIALLAPRMQTKLSSCRVQISAALRDMSTNLVVGLEQRKQVRLHVLAPIQRRLAIGLHLRHREVLSQILVIAVIWKSPQSRRYTKSGSLLHSHCKAGNGGGLPV